MKNLSKNKYSAMKIKNSNKILILILVLTIAIPLLVAQIYRHKIKTGDFEYEQPIARIGYPELNIQGSLTGIKAIKLIGSNYPELLGAIILHNDMDNYVVTREHNTDRVGINRSGDTMVFKYFSTANLKYGHIEDHRVVLRLNLPDNVPILAESCHIGIVSTSIMPDEYGKLSPAEFFLSRGTLLQLGTQSLVLKNAPDTAILGMRGDGVLLVDSTQATADSLNAIYTKMGTVRVYSNKSTVELIQPLMFERLDLTLKNGSTFKLTHPLKTKALQAIIDPKTKIVGDFKSIQSIKSLIK